MAADIHPVLRHLYPSTFYASIASSSVTLAQYDFWQIAEPIRNGAPDCAVAFADRMALVDYILLGNNTDDITKLKSLFGMPNVTHVEDVGGQLSQYTGMLSWQSRHWNPALNQTTFADICEIVQDSQAAIGRSAIADPAAAVSNGTAWNALAGWGNYTANYIATEQCGDEDQDFCRTSSATVSGRMLKSSSSGSAHLGRTDIQCLAGLGWRELVLPMLPGMGYVHARLLCIVFSLICVRYVRRLLAESLAQQLFEAIADLVHANQRLLGANLQERLP